MAEVLAMQSSVSVLQQGNPVVAEKKSKSVISTAQIVCSVAALVLLMPVCYTISPTATLVGASVGCLCGAVYEPKESRPLLKRNVEVFSRGTLALLGIMGLVWAAKSPWLAGLGATIASANLAGLAIDKLTLRVKSVE